jgi:type VII secretion integral membrane protein EccD
MNRPDAGIARPDARMDGTQFCRVTVLTPRSRMDLALPIDLTVAELVPMLTELAGESGVRDRPRPGAHGRGLSSSWCLAAVAGAELPPQATLAGLGVLDGDLLRLRRRADSPPPPVFDDPVDAVAEAIRSPDGEPDAWGEHDREGLGSAEPFVVRPWNDRCRRPTGLLIGGLTGLLAAVLLAGVRGFGNQAQPVPAVIAALAAFAALTGALRTARTDATGAVSLAFAAVPLAAAAGFAALPGPPAAGHVLLGTALAAATAAAGLALLGTAAPSLVAIVLASMLTALAALLALFGVASTGGLAASAAAIAVGLLPILPRISVRLAGLPPPVIPTTPDEMIAADAQWEVANPEEIRYQSRLAHTYLAGLVLGGSLVAGIGAVLASSTGGWAGPAFGSVVVAVLMLRSRGYVTAAASTAPLVAGLVAGTVMAFELARTGPSLARLGVALGLLVAGAIAVWLVWSGPKRESSPVVRKSVDIIEAILVIATFPLALGVLNIYALVQNSL